MIGTSTKKTKMGKYSTKVHLKQARPGTRLQDVIGFGSQSFTALGVAGYNINRKSTVSDFRKATFSLDSLRQKIASSSGNEKYVMTKFKALWNLPLEAIDTGLQGADPMNRSPEALTSPQTNFLLAPNPSQGEDTSEHPDIVDNSTETPAIHVLDRHPVPSQVVATGDIAPKVPVSVVPDQLLNLTSPDTHINAPSAPLNEIIPITPGISIGPQIASTRYIASETLEQKQARERGTESLPSLKANNEMDIGGDGKGCLALDADLGKDGSSGFLLVPLGAATNPTFDEHEKMEEKGFLASINQTHHPFRQASLFKNHDVSMKSTPILRSAEIELRKMNEARQQRVGFLDSSWTRYNAATQGVVSMEMPIMSSNPLQRTFITDYQMHGVNPFQRETVQCPWLIERKMGSFS